MASINRAIAFLRYELGDIGIVVCPVKSIARPLKGNAPTAKNTSLLEIFNIHNVKERGVTEIGTPIVTKGYIVGRAMG